MRIFLLLFAFLVFFVTVHASTNCSTGCDVDGGTMVDINVIYSGWNNGASDSSTSVKNSFGQTLAIRSTGDISNWNSTPLVDYFADYDGNYTIPVFAQGTDNNYTIRISFISGGVPQVYQDVNCVGTTCGGATKTYKFDVSNSPAVTIDDNKTMSTVVKGGKLFNAIIKMYDGTGCGLFGSGCHVNIRVRKISDGSIVAYKSDVWNNWQNNTTLDWNADYDGDYSFNVFFEGGTLQYDLNFFFIDSNNVVQNFQDRAQYIGTNLSTGQNTDYFFNVSGSPGPNIDVNQSLPNTVKGSTIFSAIIKMYDGHDCGSLSNPCGVNIKIAKASTGEVVAYRDGSWADWQSPTILDWNADYDGNYVLKIFYAGTWAQYDLNIIHTDTLGNAQLYQDTYQYIGSGVSATQNVNYYFGVNGAVQPNIDDNATMSGSVKGNTLFKAVIKMYDGNPCGLFSSSCHVNMKIKRVSDGNVVAYRDGDWRGWPNPTTLDWLADRDGSYIFEVYHEGAWLQYDLNIIRENILGGTDTFMDNYQYIGTGLSTGNFTDYTFNVANSPAVIFDYNIPLPYKAIGSSLFKARLRMYDGNPCGLFASNCHTSFAIVDKNGSTVTSISGDWVSWQTNQLLQFTPTINHDYDVRVWFEGPWVQFDLNVDYNDTTNIPRHFEDRFQYIGGGIGNYRLYPFSSGASCGNGITCAAPECKPVILNGNPDSKIDVVFVGSGFPDLNSFDMAANEMIDYDGNGHGLMAFEPFKENRDKFNFWKVNSLQTFHGGIVLGTDGNYYHDKSYEFESKNLAVASCLGVSENPMQVVTLMVNPRVQSHAYVFPFTGVGMGNAYITIGQEYIAGGTFSLIVPKIPTTPSPFLQTGLYGNNRTDVQRTVVHEFGHSFGGLADEYSSLENGTFSFGQPNCDENYLIGGYACDKWQDICPSTQSQCCLPGCSYASFFRPYQNSIMNSQFDYSTTYMPVSEHELETDINALTTTFFTQPASADYSYIFQWQYSSGNLTLINATVVNGKTFPAIIQPTNAYRMVIKSFDNQELYDVNFAMPTSINLSADYNWFDANGVQTFFPTHAPIIPVNDFNFAISSPYFGNGKEALIYDTNNNLKLAIDLSPFSTQISYFIGNGGASVNSSNYSANYTLTGQPTGILISTSYVCTLGNTN